jgi:DNA-binding XRE family transcriptional regulator
LHQEVEFYIKNNYIDESFYGACYSESREYPTYISSYEEFNPVYEKEEIKRQESVYDCRKMCSISAPFLGRTKIEDLLDKIDDTFAVSLMKLIDLKQISDVECYKKANVSKQTWYKILNEKDYKPSKNTVIAFAIALKLSYSETQKLLATVGFTLSKSSKFDLIIEYFLQNGVYDIMQINETLFEFDQPCLGV